MPYRVEMGVYLSTPKTEKASEDGENDKLRYGLSSMQGWRSTMEDAHAAHLDLDTSTSFFGVYDGHGGKVVSKFCAKYLHQQVLKHEAYLAGDLGTSLQKSFLRMDEMMCGQRGWRELAILGDKMNKVGSMIEGLIWSPRGGEANGHVNDWPSEEGPHSDFHGPTSGSTACVAIIRNNQLFVANAGDSRCVISRKGQAYNLSRDHKPDLEAEKDRIVKAGGFVQYGRVNGSLNLARAIGISSLYFLLLLKAIGAPRRQGLLGPRLKVQGEAQTSPRDMELKQNKSLPAEKQIVTANPDVNTVELCDDDEFLVIACDGIWDCMSSQQVVDYVQHQLNAETKLSVVCERVLDRCLAPSAGGEGCDNMTMILVQFKKPLNSGVSSNEQPVLLSPRV
ncbi:probable protein phosphatase 2C 60 isoform X2 [Camellia sinensis]|uniref:probable protein phosphatase 2C 60 isoform X2 n=1 Tax=Camellia sinensis TaxID=4442 RepID=UPI00103645CE|nr:probable protein phosphatase 2C 60 isoform X2 [Camellia sinensis]